MSPKPPASGRTWSGSTREHGRRVLERFAQGGHGVAHARALQAGDDPRSAGDPGIAVGHEAGALFVPREDRADRAVSHDRVEQVDVVTAGDAEDGVDPRRPATSPRPRRRRYPGGSLGGARLRSRPVIGRRSMGGGLPDSDANPRLGSSIVIASENLAATLARSPTVRRGARRRPGSPGRRSRSRRRSARSLSRVPRCTARRAPSPRCRAHSRFRGSWPGAVGARQAFAGRVRVHRWSVRRLRIASRTASLWNASNTFPVPLQSSGTRR